MVLPRNFINSRRCHLCGFALLEIVLVLAIFSSVLAATLFVTTTMYQSEIVRSERTVVIHLLQTARNNALVGRSGRAHGVAINPPGWRGYVLFIGDSLAHSAVDTRQYLPGSPAVLVASSSPPEVVFQSLSGDVIEAGAITLQDSNRAAASTTIVINHTGYVGW